MNQQWPYSHNFSFDALKPVWNIVVKSTGKIQQWSKQVTIKHGKSHKDDDKRYEDFDLPTCLNFDADKVARAYRIQCNRPNPISFHHPNSKA
eukprot:7150142-Ditylum_brightwellii.AAC.1